MTSIHPPPTRALQPSDGRDVELSILQSQRSPTHWEESSCTVGPYSIVASKSMTIPLGLVPVLTADNTVRSLKSYAAGQVITGSWDPRGANSCGHVRTLSSLQYSKYPTSIAALSFSRDGRLLAVASSYTFEEEDKPHEPDAIFVRGVNEIVVKPKPSVP
ncbi:hypothetical protein V6N13_114971 [Hibiscus sabdariffa]